MIVVTRGQIESDGPVTSTPSTAAPAHHNVKTTTVSEAGSTGRCGEHAASTDPTVSAVSWTQTSQTGTNTRSTQMGPTLQSGLPWLPTDDESGTEPEDPYSHGDQPDPLKADWERTVEGAVGGSRRLVPRRVVLVEDAECCDGRIMDPSSQRASDELRPYRERGPVNHANVGATAYSAGRSHAADYDEPKTNYYVDRDLWYTHTQSGRPCPEAVWGYRTAMPRSAPAPSAVIEPMRSVLTAPGEEGMIRGARRHPVPLDAPDVALRGQRLLAYGEQLRWEEAEVVNPAAGHARHPERTTPTYGRVTVARGSR